MILRGMTLVVGTFGLSLLSGCCRGDVCACEAEFEDVSLQGSVDTAELQAVVEAQGVESYLWLECEPVCMYVFQRDVSGPDAEPRECSVTYEANGEGAVVDCLVRSWGQC